MHAFSRKSHLIRPCPVCQNSTGAEFLHSEFFTLSDNHLLPSQYDVVSCERCGCVYAETPANQDLYDQYYFKMSKYELHSSSAESLLYMDRALWIRSFIRDPGQSVIDIGCGNGQLLLQLQRAGLTDLTGLDPSEKCISFLEGHGIQGVRSSIFSFSTTRRYDCAVLSGVLEHIYDVKRTIETLKVVLKPLGLLFICVPDSSRYVDFDSVPFDYFNIEHINHFDETSLLNLGLMHGFDTVGFLKTTVTFCQTTQPMIYCALQNSARSSSNWLSHSRNCIVDYIAHTGCNKDVTNTIAKLAESRQEIIIWGAGYYTSRLLAGSGLADCNIVMIVDNDKHKQGTIIGGKPIFPPTAILESNKKCPIVIAAAVLGDEIVGEIRRMGLDNNLIPLGKVD